MSVFDSSAALLQAHEGDGLFAKTHCSELLAVTFSQSRNSRTFSTLEKSKQTNKQSTNKNRVLRTLLEAHLPPDQQQ